MDKLLKRMILSYELHKNQAYVDRLLKEGEISGYQKILKIYNTALNNGKIIEADLIVLLQSRISIAKEELIILKAQENIFNLMNENLEDNLGTLDIANLIKENISKYPADVTARIKMRLCALKRPGKGGFTCNKDIINGSKYCDEHLKKYDKITYTDLVPND